MECRGTCDTLDVRFCLFEKNTVHWYSQLLYTKPRISVHTCWGSKVPPQICTMSKKKLVPLSWCRSRMSNNLYFVCWFDMMWDWASFNPAFHTSPQVAVADGAKATVVLVLLIAPVNSPYFAEIWGLSQTLNGFECIFAGTSSLLNFWICHFHSQRSCPYLHHDYFAKVSIVLVHAVLETGDPGLVLNSWAIEHHGNAWLHDANFASWWGETMETSDQLISQRLATENNTDLSE